MENGLFVDNDSESDFEPDSKRRKQGLWSNAFGYNEEDEEEEENEEELDILDDDISDWDEVPIEGVKESTALAQTLEARPNEFNIAIQDDKQVQQFKKRDLRKFIHEKQRKRAIHYLAMVVYIVHGYNRNQWLSNKKVHKTLRKLLPDSLMDGPVKKFSKAMKRIRNNGIESLEPSVYLEQDKQFIYILKYLIKWFRKNYKFDSNGMRVLGYIPELKLGELDKYSPKRAPSISNIKDFLSVIKKFKHNRDTGAQIFTAILRSLGFELRLIFSIPTLPKSKDAKMQPKVDFEKLERNKDNDLLYPYFWTEVVNPLDPSEIIVIETSCFHDEEKRLSRLKRFVHEKVKRDTLSSYYTDMFYPVADQFNQMTMHYVVSYSNDNLVMDVSSRYMQDVSFRWFNKLDLRIQQGRTALLFHSILRHLSHNHEYTSEDNSELDCLKEVALTNYNIPTTWSALKRNPNLVTESTLRYNEVIESSSVPLSSISLDNKKESIYFKNHVIVGKSEKQWKFLGRSIQPEQAKFPIKVTKLLPPRTIANKRIFNFNIMNNQHSLNETKLYSFNQTCSYIKMKIFIDSNGKPNLPRNRFGNLEIFRECMIPDGCCWIKLNFIESILSAYKSGKLKVPVDIEVQYVPVVTGFNFTSKAGLAIPVKKGVIVLNEQAVIAKKIWLYGRISQHSLELTERNRIALANWQGLLKRLRIKRKLEYYYGAHE